MALVQYLIHSLTHVSSYGRKPMELVFCWFICSHVEHCKFSESSIYRDPVDWTTFSIGNRKRLLHFGFLFVQRLCLELLRTQHFEYALSEEEQLNFSETQVHHMHTNVVIIYYEERFSVLFWLGLKSLRLWQQHLDHMWRYISLLINNHMGRTQFQQGTAFCI